MATTIPSGSIRFNKDSSKLELYNGEQWWEIDATSPELQTGGTRGVWFGAEAPGLSDRIQFVNVATTGNAIDFGNMTDARSELTAYSSRTRGFTRGGIYGPQPTNYVNTIEFITFGSTGNGTDFADAAYQRGQQSSCSNATRALSAGGAYGGNQVYNDIEYFTMASQANGLDFGELSVTTRGGGAYASPTRGIFSLGDSAGSTIINTIEYVTISTEGNSADFGDSSVVARYSSSCANAVRGITAGGNTGSIISTIDFVTISTLGNAKDFGDLVQSTTGALGGCASPTRGVFGGGYAPSKIDVIQYIEIMSTGDSKDFGDLLEANQYPYGCSSGHGGLS